MPITVLVADDAEIIRKAIKDIIERDPEIQLVGEAVSLKQTLQLAGELRPDIIVMDLHMGDEPDVEPLLVKTRLAESGLLGISIWADDETKALALSLGIVTLLEKRSLGTELIRAIKRCMKDGRP